MSYRIINKLCGTQAEAVKVCNALSDKVSNPHPVYSATSKSWLVVLYECEYKPRIEQAQKHYSELGIRTYIQIC